MGDSWYAARDAGLAYWNLIHPNVPGFDAADKARLDALFGSAASVLASTHNYCEVKAILHRNLPDGSMLQYGQQVHQTMGSTRDDSKRPEHHASGLPTASLMHVPETSGKDGSQPKPISGELGVPSETEAIEGVHIKERDIGSLVVASDLVCTYPPPAPPPPSLKAGGATVVLQLTASGSVSDYPDTKDLQEKIATAAGVASSLVTISVAAASVIITATISVPAGTTAASVQTLLSSKLGTAATASAALGITVESEPTIIATEAQQESSDSTLSDGEVAGVAIGAAVGGIVLLGVVGLILRSLMFKEAKPVFTCLEKAPAKSPA